MAAASLEAKETVKSLVGAGDADTVPVNIPVPTFATEGTPTVSCRAGLPKKPMSSMFHPE
jgi:hypothetical protein